MRLIKASLHFLILCALGIVISFIAMSVGKDAHPFPVKHVFAQTAADCTITQTFTSTTPGTPFSNKPTSSSGVACNAWILDYWTNGASSVSVQFEGASDSGGSPSGGYTPLTPATSPVTTTNPATGTNQGRILMCCDYYPWVRINPSTFTGTSQKMTVRVLGYKTTAQVAGGGGGGGGGGTIAKTNNTLRGDNAGNAIAVTGTATNCVLVNGTSASCGGGGGGSISNPFVLPGTGTGFAPAVTVPPTSSWTWVNQGSSTVNALTGGALTFFLGFTGGDSLLGYYQAAPGAHFTATMAQRMDGGIGAGLLIFDSVSGKGASYFWGGDGKFHGFNWNADFSFNSRIFSDLTIGLAIPQDIWYQIVIDASHQTFNYSIDGVNWLQISQVAAGAFLTPNSVGYGMDTFGVGTLTQVMLYSFASTSP